MFARQLKRVIVYGGASAMELKVLLMVYSKFVCVSLHRLYSLAPVDWRLPATLYVFTLAEGLKFSHH